MFSHLRIAIVTAVLGVVALSTDGPDCIKCWELRVGSGDSVGAAVQPAASLGPSDHLAGA